MTTLRIIETENHKTGTHKVELYVNSHWEGRYSSYLEAEAEAFRQKSSGEPATLCYRYVYISPKKEWKHEDWKEIA